MTSPDIAVREDKGPAAAGLEASAQTTAGDAESLTLGLSATASLGDSAAGSIHHPGGSSYFDATVSTASHRDGNYRTSLSPGRPAAIFPRVISAMHALEDSDDDSVFCGPPSDTEQSGLAELRALHAWGIGVQEEESHRRRRNRGDEARRRDGDGEGGGRCAPPLVQPRGDVPGDNQKFICVFAIGLEDDEEFCLVKRILGKAGNNMRRIADDYNAKVRLRGIGSGFLEGADGKEANMPLQLNVSCTEYGEYVAAVDAVATLLKDLYKHYRRYARSKGMEPPDVKIGLEEVRRDDLGINQLSAKANRSPSQRERDRRAREQERRLHREREREKAAARAAAAQAAADGTLSAATVTASARARHQSRERIEAAERRHDSSDDDYSYLDEELQLRPVATLPSGAPVPTTAAGRRAAARTGGAAAAAVASAHARETEREERERARNDREKRRRDAEDRAAAVARRPGRNAPRGMGLVTRSVGDAQQVGDNGQLPIGANIMAFQPGKGGGKGRGGKGSKGSGKGSKGKSSEADADEPPMGSLPAGAVPLRGTAPPPPPGPPPEDALVAGPVSAAPAAPAKGGRRRRN